MSLPIIIRIKKYNGKTSSYRTFFLHVSFVIFVFSNSVQASYVKISHSGSTKESQSNSFSGSYSPSAPANSVTESPWEINASLGQSVCGIDTTQVTTTSTELGTSYRSHKNFGISASITRDIANNNGATSLRPSVGLDKTWVIGAEDEDPDEDVESSEFHSRYGISITGSARSVIQKKNQVVQKDFTIEQKVFDYGIALQPFSWISVDLTRSRFSYDQSVEGADAITSSFQFNNQFGYSYSNMIQGFLDQEDAVRITFKFTTESSLSISQVKSHYIVSKNWSIDYIWNFSSTVFDSYGYSFGVIQSASSDASSPSYSGEASLAYYF